MIGSSYHFAGWQVLVMLLVATRLVDMACATSASELQTNGLTSDLDASGRSSSNLLHDAGQDAWSSSDGLRRLVERNPVHEPADHPSEDKTSNGDSGKHGKAPEGDAGTSPKGLPKDERAAGHGDADLAQSRSPQIHALMEGFKIHTGHPGGINIKYTLPRDVPEQSLLRWRDDPPVYSLPPDMVRTLWIRMLGITTAGHRMIYDLRETRHPMGESYSERTFEPRGGHTFSHPEAPKSVLWFPEHLLRWQRLTPIFDNESMRLPGISRPVVGTQAPSMTTLDWSQKTEVIAEIQVHMRGIGRHFTPDEEALLDAFLAAFQYPLAIYSQGSLHRHKIQHDSRSNTAKEWRRGGEPIVMRSKQPSTYDFYQTQPPPTPPWPRTGHKLGGSGKTLEQQRQELQQSMQERRQ